MSTLGVSPDRRSSAGIVSSPWGPWATLTWLALALLLHEGFARLEVALLRGTWFGHLIDRTIALGALNIVLVWSVPLIVLIVAVRVRGCAVRNYFGWVGARAGYLIGGIVFALAIQAAFSTLFYLLGADWSAAVEEYGADRIAGVPHWTHVLEAWPAIICAPIVEESMFRGFLWRGWASSRLGSLGTWLLGSLVFTAWHIPKAMGMSTVAGSFMLAQVLVLGLFLSWLRWRSGGTTAGILAHAAANIYPPVVGLVMGALLS